jgi:hypothetical protein
VEKTLWKLALGRFARVVLTEMKGKRVVTTFPIGLRRSKRVVKTQTVLGTKSHHRKGNNRKNI